MLRRVMLVFFLHYLHLQFVFFYERERECAVCENAMVEKTVFDDLISILIT